MTLWACNVALSDRKHVGVERGMVSRVQRSVVEGLQSKISTSTILILEKGPGLQFFTSRPVEGFYTVLF